MSLKALRRVQLGSALYEQDAELPADLTPDQVAELVRLQVLPASALEERRTPARRRARSEAAQ